MRFNLKTETESSLRKVMFLDENRAIGVQKHNIGIENVVYAKYGYYPDATAKGQRPWTSSGISLLLPYPTTNTKH
jgi:hypothetical protein